MSTTSSPAENASAPSGFDWDNIADGSAKSSTSAAPAVSNLPPTPPNTALIAGRLPIKGDTGRAIIQLPEKVKLVHCALAVANTSVLSDCYRPAKNVCIPNALRARPLNDREFEVILDGGDGVVKGLGWTKDGAYPGALPVTRSVETGVPFVEILVMVGIDCGCNSENWADDNEWP